MKGADLMETSCSSRALIPKWLAFGVILAAMHANSSAIVSARQDTGELLDQINGRTQLPLYNALKQQLAEVDQSNTHDVLVMFLGIGSDTREAHKTAVEMSNRLGVRVIALPVYTTGNSTADLWTAVSDFTQYDRQVGIGFALERIIEHQHGIKGIVFFSGGGIVGNAERTVWTELAEKYPRAIRGPVLWVCTAESRATASDLNRMGIAHLEIHVADGVKDVTRPGADLLLMPRSFPGAGVAGTLVKLVNLVNFTLDNHSLAKCAPYISQALGFDPFPLYVVSTETGSVALSNAKGVRWQKTPETDGWVLVGPEGASESECVPVLVTKLQESAESVAQKIRSRNEREHPGERAIVLLDGDPKSERNRALVEALRKNGYGDTDILVVKNGDLYDTHGNFLFSGESVLPEGAAQDPVLAQGIWGKALQNYAHRPVYGDPLGPDRRMTEAKMVDKRSEGSEPLESPGGILVAPEPKGEKKNLKTEKDQILIRKPAHDSLTWPVDSSSEKKR